MDRAQNKAVDLHLIEQKRLIRLAIGEIETDTQTHVDTLWEIDDLSATARLTVTTQANQKFKKRWKKRMLTRENLAKRLI